MYYNSCNRNHYGKHIASLLEDLKNGKYKELILDIRDNFLCCSLHYELQNTYTSLEDSVLVTRYGTDYLVIDCSEYVPGYSIYNYLNGNISLHDLLEKRNYKNIYRGEIFWDGLRPTLRVTL